MNYSSAVMLINDKIRAVKAIYENENENQTSRNLFQNFGQLNISWRSCCRANGYDIK